MSETVPASIELISDSDWAQTPDSVKRRLVGRIEPLEQQYEALKAENAMLREPIERNSQTSSKPPSQDIRKGFKSQEKKEKGKPRGAQFGHGGHEPKFYPLVQLVISGGRKSSMSAYGIVDTYQSNSDPHLR